MEKKKILKTTQTLCIISGIVFMTSSLGGIVYTMAESMKTQESLDKLEETIGLEEFNEIYKKDKAEEYQTMYESGQLSYEEYQTKLEKITDLELVEYINNYASAEELEKYKEIQAENDQMLGMTLSVGALLVANAGLIGANVIDKKIKKEELDFLYQNTAPNMQYMDYPQYVDSDGIKQTTKIITQKERDEILNAQLSYLSEGRNLGD